MRKKIFVAAALGLTLFAVAVGFVIIARQKTLPFPIPLLHILQPGGELQGIWKTEQFLLEDKTGQMKEMKPPQGGELNNYIEFKDDQMCTDGKLNRDGLPLPCQQYQPFTIKGSTIIIPQGGQTSAQGVWKLTGDVLEMDIATFAGAPMKAKWVLRKLETPSSVSFSIHFPEGGDDRDVAIFVDGDRVSDFVLFNPKRGSHTLRCSKPGYLDSETKFDYPGASAVQCVMSKTAPVSFEVRDPDGNRVDANIIIDGNLQGFFNAGSYPLGFGSHTILCEREGYQPYETTVSVSKFVPQKAGTSGTYYNLTCLLKP